MKITFFDIKPYDIASFDKYGKKDGFEFKYYQTRLNEDTSLAEGSEANYHISSFSVANAHNRQSAKWGQSVSFQVTAFRDLGLKVGDTLTAIKN